MKWLSLAAILLSLHTGPVISVSPDSGLLGTEFDVAGSGFVPGEKLKLRWDGAELKRTVTVGSDGTFTYSAVIPNGATLGAHSIEANALGQGTSSATTTFTVISASTTSTTVTSTSSAPTTSPTTSAATTPATTAATTATTSGSNIGGSGLAETGADAGSEEITEVPGTAGLSKTPAPGGLDSTVTPGAGETTPSAPTSREGMGITGGLIAVLAIIGIVGGAMYLLFGRSRKDDEDPEASSGPAGEDVSLLPPLSPADIESREGNWVRQMMRLAPEDEITSVLATSAGLVGLGRTTAVDSRGEAAIWNSGDGVEWERVATVGKFGALLAIPMQDGVMSTVSHEYEGQMSTSCWFSGGGRNWELMTADGDDSLAGVSFEGGVAGDKAVVAWGRDANGPGVWLSRDGISWHQSALRGDLDLITHTADGLLAFGRHLNERRPLVARSSDGVSWDLLGGDSRFGLEEASVAALVSFQGGMVAAGSDQLRGIGAIWVSDDGEFWHRVPFEPDAGTSIDYLAATDDRLLAVGSDSRRRRGGRGTVVIWESQDAISWTRLARSKMFSNAVANSVVIFDKSIRAFGTLFEDRDGAESETIPVSWEWTQIQSSDRNADDVHNPHDPLVDQELELAAGGASGSSDRP